MANDVPCPPSPGHDWNVPALGGPLLQNVSFWVLSLSWGDQDTWFFHSSLQNKIDGEGEKMPLILGSTEESLKKLMVWIVESARMA